MKYPRYTLGVQYDTVGAYTRFIGEREHYDEATLSANPKGSPRRVARMIGRACNLRMQGGGREGATRVLRRAEMQAAGPLQTCEGRALRRLGMTAHLLLATPREVSGVRQATHAEVIAQLTEVENQLRHGKPNGHRSKLVGEASELISLGLVTRQVHPSTLAMPALTHHDELTSARDNHDVVLVSGMPDQGGYQIERQQVKTCCLRLCNSYPVQPALFQDEYSSEVTLLSGHCDLALPDGGLKGTADLLIQEYGSEASVSQVDTLDSLTGNLVLAMTMHDPRRMGSLAPESSLVSVAA
jgi:hypothetical protein